MKYGFNADVPEQDYFAFDALSSSGLKLMGNGEPWSKGCPALYKFHKDNPDFRDSNPAQKTGTLLHMLILEPHKFDDRYFVTDIPNMNSKAGREAKEKNKGKDYIKVKDYEIYEQIRAGVYKNEHAQRLLASGFPEYSYVWEDPVYGHTCKARGDFVNVEANTIVDIKTTSEPTPAKWARSAIHWQYNIQAAFYCQGYELLTGVCPEFYFISVQTVPPFETVVYKADEYFLQEGLAYVNRAVELYHDCNESDDWPGFADGLQKLTASDYYFDELMKGTRAHG